MTDAGQTVALCMIVKNERPVLERCLQSVLPWIDHWTVVDTGSNDGTQELVRACLGSKPGQLVERPWQNFGWNRTEAVGLARASADYLLTLDADEYLLTEPGFRWPTLQHDAYTFQVDSGGVLYARTQLVRSSLPWRYQGVLHEYITCDGPHTEQRMQGVMTIRLPEGARARDPLTYQRDVDVLELALRDDPGNRRHLFYLAQSHRDAHQHAPALRRYRERAAAGGFPEEIWCSLYEAAKLMCVLGEDWTVVQEAFLDAYRYRPSRAEPLYRIGVFYSNEGHYEEALRYLEHALQIPQPATESLFVEADVYRFLLPLEYAVVCSWLGRHTEAIALTDRLLGTDGLTAERKALLLRNRQFSVSSVSSVQQSQEQLSGGE